MSHEKTNSTLEQLRKQAATESKIEVAEMHRKAGIQVKPESESGSAASTMLAMANTLMGTSVDSPGVIDEAVKDLVTPTEQAAKAMIDYGVTFESEIDPEPVEGWYRDILGSSINDLAKNLQFCAGNLKEFSKRLFNKSRMSENTKFKKKDARILAAAIVEGLYDQWCESEGKKAYFHPEESIKPSEDIEPLVDPDPELEIRFVEPLEPAPESPDTTPVITEEDVEEFELTQAFLTGQRVIDIGEYLGIGNITAFINLVREITGRDKMRERDKLSKSNGEKLMVWFKDNELPEEIYHPDLIPGEKTLAEVFKKEDLDETPMDPTEEAAVEADIDKVMIGIMGEGAIMVKPGVYKKEFPISKDLQKRVDPDETGCDIATPKELDSLDMLIDYYKGESLVWVAANLGLSDDTVKQIFLGVSGKKRVQMTRALYKDEAEMLAGEMIHLGHANEKYLMDIAGANNLMATNPVKPKPEPVAPLMDVVDGEYVVNDNGEIKDPAQYEFVEGTLQKSSTDVAEPDSGSTIPDQPSKSQDDDPGVENDCLPAIDNHEPIMTVMGKLRALEYINCDAYFMESYISPFGREYCIQNIVRRYIQVAVVSLDSDHHAHCEVVQIPDIGICCFIW